MPKRGPNRPRVGRHEACPYVAVGSLTRFLLPLTELADRHPRFRPVSSGSVVAEMRALRARVKPDPEGWTTRDYVNYGRK